MRTQDANGDRRSPEAPSWFRSEGRGLRPRPLALLHALLLLLLHVVLHARALVPALDESSAPLPVRRTPLQAVRRGEEP